MGSLRVFLALSVVFGHVLNTRWGVFTWPPEAVSSFFIISGFYMSLVLSAKYEGRSWLWRFYSNRALRLYPAYFAALLLGLAADSTSRAAGLLVQSAWLPFTEGLLLVLPNLTIFGSDLLFQFNRGYYLVVSPIWSVGLEMWFYFLAPMLVRTPTFALCAMTGASMALRGWMEMRQPWSSYFLFQANFCFFGLGVLVHRFWDSKLFRQLDGRIYIAGAVFGTVFILFRNYLPGFRNQPWMIYTTIAATLPFLFQVTKSQPIDRHIGDLSYGIYLFHDPVTKLSISYLGGLSLWTVTAVTVVLAIATYHLIERPVDELRQRRAS